MANHNKRKQLNVQTNVYLKQIIHVTGAKHRKTCVTESWLVLVLHLVDSDAVQLQISFDTQLKIVLLEGILHFTNGLTYISNLGIFASEKF